MVWTWTSCWVRPRSSRCSCTVPPEAAQKQDSLLTCLRKGKKEVPPMEKPQVVKIHLRNMVILPKMVGSMVGTYDGKTFKQVETKLQVSSPSPTSLWSTVGLVPIPPASSPPRSRGQKTCVQSPRKTKSSYDKKWIILKKKPHQGSFYDIGKRVNFICSGLNDTSWLLLPADCHAFRKFLETEM